MSKEILYVVDAVSNEKNVDADIIFEAVEIALATATRKKHNPQMDVRVSIDRETGEYETFRRWEVLDDESEEFESPEKQILYSYAKNDGHDVEIGDFVEEPIESIEFGRIAAQTAKQVIVQKVRQAERERIVEGFRDRVGQLILGTVKRVDHRGIVLDMGENAEALIPRDQMLPKDMVRPGDRMRGYLKEILDTGRGPQMIVSRTDANLLIELLKLEVPEIGQEMIDIMAASRDPGSRAKIAVRANIPNLDPVGACVGMRGSRIQTVTNELNDERVDIIPWDDDIANFVINSMKPAEVLSIVVDEENKTMRIGVDEDQLSQAIGKGGQNVRLASELTGWQLDIMSEQEADDANLKEQQLIVDKFIEKLDIDEDIATILVEEGFTSLDELVYDFDDVCAIDEFNEELAEELRSRAQNTLLTQAISGTSGSPQQDLLEMDSMTNPLAYKLAAKGIYTMEDLAEQATDDLLDIDDMTEERAGELIMIARAPWFAEESAEDE
ncbi:MAG: Transcription termination protein NusA [uncultured Thiotrichaceae bacterium]|uniref:Transcription termination/antitermination protein NusA n=1 Tax=uncultured Thiotrichaceae bacterium TaxID=298394 RepID=A0A6S6S9D2_9GAMM|nr:MAG: Transcription termination protein NusA [uncultured Thiotrichaceae bacterium]